MIIGGPIPEGQELALIVEVVRDLGSTFDLDTLLSRVATTSLRVLNCDRATVFLYDPASDELYSRVATGIEQLRFSARSGIAGQAVQTRRPILVPDAYADPRFNRSIDEQTGYRTRNLLTFPLLGHDGAVVGVLQVLNKLRGEFHDRDELLADTLSKLAGVAVERQILLDQYREKLKLENDLDLARRIQQRLLPQESPQVAGFDVAGWNKPADQTGGDCFDFFAMGDGRLGILIADATGHGIGPALIVAQCRAILRSAASMCRDLQEITDHVNRLLSADTPSDRFVTACIGALDAANAAFTYASAGHGPILHLHADTGTADELPPTGIPMGIVADERYDVAGPIPLRRGDTMAVLTDGFVEWEAPDGEQFGVERAVRVLRDHGTCSSAAAIQALYEAVLRFGRGSPQRDDLTAVVIRRP